MYCHKNAERACNDSCSAYCSDARHGTNCLELATMMESCARAKHMALSNELYAANTRLLFQELQSFESTIKGMLG